MPIVDPELRDLIPPLTPGERAALRESIQQDGVRDPIVLWGDTVVDGHNRLEIAQELGVSCPITRQDFADRAEARQWILENQCARRNLTPDQVAALSAMRGVQPPSSFRSYAAAKQAQELVAAGVDLSRVLQGKRPLRGVWRDLQRAQGKIPSRGQKRKTGPSPAPPLEAARGQRAERDAQTAERRALKQAIGRLDRAEQTLAAIDRLASVRVPPVVPPRVVKGKRTAVAVTMLSDVHAGACFPETNSTFGNRYNKAIALSRVRRFFWLQHYMLTVHRQWATLDHLVIAMLGDLVDGHLHDEQVETSEAPLETMHWLLPEIIAGVRGLAQVADVTIVGAYGNHARLTNKVRWITGWRHNVEYYGYQTMRTELAGDGVKVVAEPCEDQYHKIYGHTLHATHGTTVRYQGGIQGVQTPLNKAAFAWNDQRKADYHLLGHLHQGLYGGNWFLNGSVVGFGPHAAALRCKPEQPAQWWFALVEGRGATAMTPLWVGDRKDEAGL